MTESEYFDIPNAIKEIRNEKEDELKRLSINPQVREALRAVLVILKYKEITLKTTFPQKEDMTKEQLKAHLAGLGEAQSLIDTTLKTKEK